MIESMVKFPSLMIRICVFFNLKFLYFYTGTSLIQITVSCFDLWYNVLYNEC